VHGIVQRLIDHGTAARADRWQSEKYYPEVIGVMELLFSGLQTTDTSMSTSSSRGRVSRPSASRRGCPLAKLAPLFVGYYPT
jgi:hypothetical protein